MNCKFKKNSKKIKKYWIYLASKRLECTRCLQVLVIKWRTRRSREKRQNSAFFQSFFDLKFVFFSTSSYDVQTQQKCAHILRTWVSLVPLNFIFLLFFSIFLNLRFTCVQKLCFPLPRAPRVSEWHENLYTPCRHEYLRSHKVSIFFLFFCYFFRTVKDLWPNGNDREGHFYKWN